MEKNERNRVAVGVCVFIVWLCPPGVARVITVDNRGDSYRLTGIVDILACDIQGDQSEVYIYGDPRCLQFDWGTGNIDADPLFADPADSDCHLKSQVGRWEAASQTWVIDDVTSPCIDAGDPNSPVGDEPEPNGGRINMGAYGGTAEASKSCPGG
ncbi:MAG: hypothetical protein JW955_00750 [Sedimentisphaerales bacterium]|nr:hypothetical protein [Sedimentisphaerales bacterium]